MSTDTEVSLSIPRDRIVLSTTQPSELLIGTPELTFPALPEKQQLRRGYQLNLRPRQVKAFYWDTSTLFGRMSGTALNRRGCKRLREERGKEKYRHTGDQCQSRQFAQPPAPK